MKLHIVIAIMLFSSLASCVRDRVSQNSSSQISNTSIIGEWVEYDTSDPYAEDYLTVHFIFNANGTGYWKLMGDLHSPYVERDRGSFSWKQNGNTVSITEPDGNYYELAYHGNELVRTGNLGVETYKKKR